MDDDYLRIVPQSAALFKEMIYRDRDDNTFPVIGPVRALPAVLDGSRIRTCSGYSWDWTSIYKALSIISSQSIDVSMFFDKTGSDLGAHSSKSSPRSLLRLSSPRVAFLLLTSSYLLSSP